MTVGRADYGLSTLMWPKHHFQVASGQQRTRLKQGDNVAITRFRNGDQLIVNQDTNETFFVFANSNKLLACMRSEKRDVEVLSLERNDNSQRPDA